MLIELKLDSKDVATMQLALQHLAMSAQDASQQITAQVAAQIAAAQAPEVTKMTEGDL